MSDQPTQTYQGTVIAVQANFYRVRLTEKVGEWRFLLCTRRSRLKKIGQQVMVGDQVLLDEIDSEDGRGAIAQILPRQTELQRPPVANAEQILLVFALEEPTLDPWQLSRFLIKAESTQLTPLLCLNKSDLISAAEQQAWQERLQKWGYDPLFLSVMEGKGLEALKAQLGAKITIVAGPSGVGKSSLINCLIPEAHLRVKSVSGKLHRGRHTTRHVELFELPKGGLLADSPGFNKPNLDSEPRELAQYFPEARERLQRENCQFSDCLHRDEPNCGVRGDWERYDHYEKFLEEAIAQAEQRHQRPNEEKHLKLKIKQSGEKVYEPRLESKKYRRQSRKSRHQTLQDLIEEAEDF
ncbi:small ribosomal subunit biogenesis GTPase RsgA [Spirulina sp. CS-785/01]|uniref:small ribosomal subunit biogenesis GTPase RsgA n=1 Tax=Spirulina sp. CS-785/01 TaxID=3021716 RepID=UPI00232FA8D1|nr:small ribosomal subunit biogenesis GTPase RsgA [Spirulina sp. CS-785/01]MDB9314447.1 small ribosomal subunit biogenesis GTPase RsgA [Spirulina sp. CS-785/01]